MSILQTKTITFTNNVRLALQQTNSRLAPHAIQQGATGEMQEIVNLVQPVQPQRRTERFSPVEMKTNDNVRRWAPRTACYYDSRGVDSIDQVEAMIDLQGQATMTIAAMIARARDIAFLEGFYGTNYTGKRGETAVTFAAGNIVPANTGAAAATGMNVTKLRAAQRVLRENLVDTTTEECYMALTAEQVFDLQGEIQMTSYDFNRADAPVLKDGRLTKLLGFNFIEMEFGNTAVVGTEIAALTLDGSGHRRVPFWCRSGMAMATWMDQNTYVTERTDLAGKPILIYGETMLTATRTEEGKCGQVLCLEP